MGSSLGWKQLQGEASDHKHQRHTNQATMAALLPCSWLWSCHIAQKEKKETAPSDKRDAQMLTQQMFHLVEDDQIYRLCRTCIAPFSNNRSTLSLPVGKEAINIMTIKILTNINMPVNIQQISYRS